ncbi:hypothetical protein J5N97_018125 [Dioscorea zingiberensis]|uniref:Uncharacterized protein n=1 Tax=Dioscorea zingiberensis TaxID=325984 RepID=A0A9D5CMR8_9LILI|nr:hypothetical protein J5N97_018125 [Dioscorea zingiberensis]
MVLEIDPAGAFYSQLSSVMPLKSDDSLYLMEALSRSHQEAGLMVATQSPKLEEYFLGCGPDMGANNDRSCSAMKFISQY